MASLRGAGLVAAMSLTVSLVVIIVLVGLGLAVPAGTNPFFYFALILFGGGAFGLLFAGVGAVFARARTPTVPSADLDFFAGVRRLALAMWLCALVTDALGVLIVLALTGRTGDTPLGTGTLITAFTVAAVTFICTGVSSVVMRRLLPRR
jgi:hypothetical protein